MTLLEPSSSSFAPIASFALGDMILVTIK
jgi:hypothetical protein